MSGRIDEIQIVDWFYGNAKRFVDLYDRLHEAEKARDESRAKVANLETGLGLLEAERNTFRARCEELLHTIADLQTAVDEDQLDHDNLIGYTKRIQPGAHNVYEVLDQIPVLRQKVAELEGQNAELAAALKYVDESLAKEFTGIHVQLILATLRGQVGAILARHDAHVRAKMLRKAAEQRDGWIAGRGPADCQIQLAGVLVSTLEAMASEEEAGL